jgi:glycosyltransferase involved in cell wall biosynthesis
MKLIVQIPCLNEEKTLPLVINSIPRKIKGVDKVEILIINDGSSDKTVDVAKANGADHIISHKRNKGLAAAFATGINESIRLGADIIVNTDADNQYPGEDIPRLIKPILDGTHDIVVANRQTDKIRWFSKPKKLFQKFGSRMVQLASGTKIPDAPSGFRAYSREAAMEMNIVTDFSYVIETIVQAGKKKIAITHIPIIVNKVTRKSRLFSSMFGHMYRSGQAIIRSYSMYEPMKIFLVSGTLIFLIGLIPFVFFVAQSLIMRTPIAGHIQSLIFGGVFMILGVMMSVMGVMADLIAIERKLIEDALFRLKNVEVKLTEPKPPRLRKKRKKESEKIDKRVRYGKLII